MKPVNNKSLFHSLCDDYDKLKNGEIKNEDAAARAFVADKIIKCMYYELNLAKVQFTLKDTAIKVRNIELKEFKESEKLLNA